VLNSACPIGNVQVQRNVAGAYGSGGTVENIRFPISVAQRRFHLRNAVLLASRKASATGNSMLRFRELLLAGKLLLFEDGYTVQD
jgi:hypothetical protein